MSFVKQLRRGRLDGLPSRSYGRRGRSVARWMSRALREALSPACAACVRLRGLRLAPFHHAAMVLPAQTRVKAACRRHCVMGCAQP